jgi:hypothetical protein
MNVQGITHMFPKLIELGPYVAGKGDDASTGIAVTENNHAEARAHLVLLALQVYPLLHKHVPDLRISVLYEMDPREMTTTSGRAPIAKIRRYTKDDKNVIIYIALRNRQFVNRLLQPIDMIANLLHAIGLCVRPTDPDGMAHELMQEFKTHYAARVPKTFGHLVVMGALPADYMTQWRPDTYPWWPLGSVVPFGQALAAAQERHQSEADRLRNVERNKRLQAVLQRMNKP